MNGLLKDKEQPELTSYKRFMPWAVGMVWIGAIIHAVWNQVAIDPTVTGSFQWLMGISSSPLVVKELQGLFK